MLESSANRHWSAGRARRPSWRRTALLTARWMRHSGARALVWLCGLAICMSPNAQALACPFCDSVETTLTEEIRQAEFAVVARLVEPPNRDLPADSPQADRATFEIIQVLQGAPTLGNTRSINTLYFGQQPVGTPFLFTGTDPTNPAWSTPQALTEAGVQYVSKLLALPKSGPERLVFFKDYLQHDDLLLNEDAYGEFARAPYADVKAIKDQMPRQQLLAWIQDDDVSPSHRRLYLTLLGVCGQPEDIPVLEALIRTETRTARKALDALAAAYLCLKGEEGLPLIEELFFKNPNAEYVDSYGAVMALRFHGEEASIIPKARLAQSIRLMLDRPTLADLVIPDLARWEDWSAVDQMVKLFKDANDEDSKWVRQPVVRYLMACPLPEAAEHLKELAEIDPVAFKRANMFMPFTRSAAEPGPGAVRPPEKQKPGAEQTDATKPAISQDSAAPAPAATDSTRQQQALPNELGPSELGSGELRAAPAAPPLADAPRAVKAVATSESRSASTFATESTDPAKPTASAGLIESAKPTGSRPTSAPQSGVRRAEYRRIEAAPTTRSVVPLSAAPLSATPAEADAEPVQTVAAPIEAAVYASVATADSSMQLTSAAEPVTQSRSAIATEPASQPIANTNPTVAKAATQIASLSQLRGEMQPRIEVSTGTVLLWSSLVGSVLMGLTFLVLRSGTSPL